MLGIIPKQSSKRRRLVARRPHPDVEYFFSQYHRHSCATNRSDDGHPYDDLKPKIQDRSRDRH